MTEIKDRWYQVEAVEAFTNFIQTHPTGDNPCLVLPTGTGKSIVIARLVQHALQWPENKVMVLTHVGELVRQNVDKLKAVWPDAPVGIFSATLKSKDTGARVVFGNMQSVCRRLKADPKAFGARQLLVIDECHLVSDKENSQYQTLIRALKESAPELRICGLSATPYRTTGGLLTEQDNAVFTHIAYDLTSQFNRLIAEGYLAPLVSPKVDINLDFSKVHIRQGDFKQDEVQQIINYKVLNEACTYTVEAGKDRRAWLVFVNSIFNADVVAKLLELKGVEARAVHSKKSAEWNEQAILDFRQGKIRALVSADQLTTGFDVPQVDLIAMLRPTMSTCLHVQALGRGTRPARGKQDCLVLDFVHNTERLGPINSPYIRDKPDKKGPVQTRLVADQAFQECPHCGAGFSTRERYCPACGADVRQLEADMQVSGINLIDDVFHGYTRTKGARLAIVSSMVVSTKKSTYNDQPYLDVCLACRSGIKTFKVFQRLKFNTTRQIADSVSMWEFYRGAKPAPVTLKAAITRANELQRPRGIEVKRANFVTSYQDVVTKVFY